MPTPPGWVIRLIVRLRLALIRLTRSLVPPEVVAFELATSAATTLGMSALVRHGLPDLLVRPVTLGELAAATGLNANALGRLLRAQATIGVLDLLPDGRFVANPITHTLRRGGAGCDDVVRFFASPENLGAWANLDAALRDGAEPWRTANGSDLWASLRANPAADAAFHGMMACFTRSQAPLIVAEWPVPAKGVVADLGGGDGTLLAHLLAANPDLQGVVLDQASAATPAAARFAEAGLSDRAKHLTADLFAPPSVQADTWVCKQVLHDWGDEDCARILRGVRAAMRPADRLVLIELLRDDHAPGSHALIDAQMMVVTSGGRERTLAELEDLLTGAGLRLERHSMTAADLALLLAAPA